MGISGDEYDMAYEAGYSCGLDGACYDNPYEGEDELSIAWELGYQDGYDEGHDEYDNDDNDWNYCDGYEDLEDLQF